MSAPIAAPRPFERLHHGKVRVDEYAWLSDRENPEVLDHLRAENAYTEGSLAHLADLREAIFGEIRDRTLETDVSVPVPRGPWEYYARTTEGSQYPVHCRRPRGAADDSGEQVLLDLNVIAESLGAEHLLLGTLDISPDHRLLAYAIDTEGDEVFELRFKDLATGTELPDVIDEVASGGAWSSGGTHFFYLTLDDTMRPHQLWAHAMGSSSGADDDRLVYEESDERFFLGVDVSSTEEHIVLTSGSQITTEQRTMRADEPDATPVVVEVRRNGVEYGIDDHRAVDGSTRWFRMTNDGVENFTLHVDGSRLCFPDGRPVADGVAKLDGFEVFRSHVVLYERFDALERIRIVRLDDAGAPIDDRMLSHPDAVHSVWGADNVELDAPVMRFGYTSMNRPTGLYEEHLTTGERRLLKEQPVLGGFTPDQYVTDRVWAFADDGTRIPISLVRKASTPLDGTAPAVLYGYGAYEISIDPSFSVARLSLLDRGIVFAIAHIRGGGELGRSWYLQGKFLRKRTTFTDFLACAKYLGDEGLVDASRIACRGGSAGGLLVGASLHIEPTRFRALVAEVPFVDVLTTMLDDSLPLTEIEKDEWGDPNDPEYYAYLASYAPFENVGATSYPAMLVTAGLNDPRVSYWEPAKWVQRIRDRMTGGGPVYLRTELGAGHGGPTGRYDAWRDEAFTLAFLVDALGASTPNG